MILKFHYRDSEPVEQEITREDWQRNASLVLDERDPAITAITLDSYVIYPFSLNNFPKVRR